MIVSHLSAHSARFAALVLAMLIAAGAMFAATGVGLASDPCEAQGDSTCSPYPQQTAAPEPEPEPTEKRKAGRTATTITNVILFGGIGIFHPGAGVAVGVGLGVSGRDQTIATAIQGYYIRPPSECRYESPGANFFGMPLPPVKICD